MGSGCTTIPPLFDKFNPSTTGIQGESIKLTTFAMTSIGALNKFGSILLLEGMLKIFALDFLFFLDLYIGDTTSLGTRGSDEGVEIILMRQSARPGNDAEGKIGITSHGMFRSVVGEDGEYVFGVWRRGGRSDDGSHGHGHSHVGGGDVGR
jgi:hypothetical protein